MKMLGNWEPRTTRAGQGRSESAFTHQASCFYWFVCLKIIWASGLKPSLDSVNPWINLSSLRFVMTLKESDQRPIVVHQQSLTEDAPAGAGQRGRYPFDGLESSGDLWSIGCFLGCEEQSGPESLGLLEL